jgi:hypothetical protein
MSKVPERRAFDLNLTMTWNDVEQIRTRLRRMWACAETNDDYQNLQNLEDAMTLLSDSIRATLAKR